MGGAIPDQVAIHIQNEGGVQQQVHRGLLGSILNERRHPGPCGHLPYLVVSKMRVTFWIKWLSPVFGSIQKEGYHPGSWGHPPYLVLSKMRVASRIMGHPPLSDPIQDEGWHPGSWGRPPYLVLSKIRVQDNIPTPRQHPNA